jgi:hypothetical protein
MPEILRGNLRKLPLLDILKILISARRTGRLDFKNNARVGEIYLQDGNLVHAVTGAQMGESAIYSLMGWFEGDFNFVSDAEAPERSVEKKAEILLQEAAKQAEEWEKIKKVIPSTDVVFKLSAAGSANTVSLQPEDWQVLAQVNGAQTVAEIAEAVGRDEFTVAKVLYGLAKGALLEVGEKPQARLKATINTTFFGKLEREFIEVMGPMGPLLIDEVIATLGETHDAFPRDRIAELVQGISTYIKDDAKRMRFQQIMFDILRGL